MYLLGIFFNLYLLLNYVKANTKVEQILFWLVCITVPFVGIVIIGITVKIGRRKNEVTYS